MSRTKHGRAASESKNQGRTRKRASGEKREGMEERQATWKVRCAKPLSGSCLLSVSKREGGGARPGFAVRRCAKTQGSAKIEC